MRFSRCASSQSAPLVAQSPLRLGDLYRQVQRAKPRVLAATALARAADARVPGSARPPDPQLQLGFMNYTLPNIAPMSTVGMTQLTVMQMLPLGGKLPRRWWAG